MDASRAASQICAFCTVVSWSQRANEQYLQGVSDLLWVKLLSDAGRYRWSSKKTGVKLTATRWQTAGRLCSTPTVYESHRA